MYSRISDLIVWGNFLAVVTHATAPTDRTPSATIDAGVIVGTATKLASSTVTVNKFLGVPFAAPPARFAPPHKPRKWTHPLNTSAYAPSCIQQFSYPEGAREFIMSVFDTPSPPAGESEDCLYLNVYAPASPSTGTGRTVMFWIYGGELRFGSNSDLRYDGTRFAATQDVIIVAPNYRANVFGFPAAPELPLDQRNLGFLDQRLALDWVKNNIGAFGGDPKKVTIFGESSGAGSVDELLTTMPDDPPFRAAIMESGQTSFWVNHNNSDVPAWDALVAGLNCSTSADVLACVRAVDVLTVKATEEHMALDFKPVSDNVTQLEFPEQARKAGRIARVPIMTGTNAQEGRLFVVGQHNTRAYLNATFPGLTTLQDAIIAAYPQGSPSLESSYDVIAAIYTDFSFHCPCGQLANDSAAAGIPTWRYYFNATFENTQVYPGLGVYHFSEVPIVFGTYPRVNATSDEVALSNYMQTAWATFAKDPMGGPSWPAVPSVGVLGTPGAGLRRDKPAGSLDARCALYANVYAALGI